MNPSLSVIRLGAAPLVHPANTGVFGGAEVRAFLFAQGLTELAGADVELVVDAGTRATWNCGKLAVRSLPAPTGGRGRERALWARSAGRLARLRSSVARRWTGQPDFWPDVAALKSQIVGSFGLHDPTASVVRTARESGKRSIVFLTSDDETQAALHPDAACHRHRRWHRYALEHADLIVAQTCWQYRCLAPLQRPVALIRNPIDTKLPPGESIRPMHRRKHVLWMGRADVDCKRADLCLQIAAACPSVPFVAVMNPGDEATFGQLVSVCPANVRVLRRIDWALGDRLYRDALVLLNTSQSEGFPNAFLQAAKWGVPVFSRRVDPDRVLTDYGFGLVASDDLQSLAAWVRQVHASPDEFDAMSRAARRYVEDRHALEARVTELHTVLQSMTDPTAASRLAAGGKRAEQGRGSPTRLAAVGQRAGPGTD